MFALLMAAFLAAPVGTASSALNRSQECIGQPMRFEQERIHPLRPVLSATTFFQRIYRVSGITELALVVDGVALPLPQRGCSAGASADLRRLWSVGGDGTIHVYSHEDSEIDLISSHPPSDGSGRYFDPVRVGPNLIWVFRPTDDARVRVDEIDLLDGRRYPTTVSFERLPGGGHGLQVGDDGAIYLGGERIVNGARESLQLPDVPGCRPKAIGLRSRVLTYRCKSGLLVSDWEGRTIRWFPDTLVDHQGQPFLEMGFGGLSIDGRSLCWQVLPVGADWYEADATPICTTIPVQDAALPSGHRPSTANWAKESPFRVQQ